LTGTVPVRHAVAERLYNNAGSALHTLAFLIIIFCVVVGLQHSI